MKNQDSSKTEMRSQPMPTQPPSHQETGQSANALPLGTRLGEFEIVDLIGEGGFGIVYLAYDHSLERHVALKEYMPSGLATRTIHMAVHVRSKQHIDTFAVGLKSFINEARMLAKFDSPALLKVHSFWEGNGTAYMVMPHYEGVTLKQALHEKRIKPTEAWLRVLLADLLDAAEILHRANCLHRDIAPDNILLLKDGRPLLLDFGAARRVIGDLTQLFTAFLKPGFAPIEQYADIPGLRQGAWTDIYALAAVAYYLISGETPPAAVARMVRDEMKPAREIGKGAYSERFLSALDKAMAVKPEHRYQSIAELRSALDIMETVPRSMPSSAAAIASAAASGSLPTTAPTASFATSATPLPADGAAPAEMMQNTPAAPGNMPHVKKDADYLAATGDRPQDQPSFERPLRADGEPGVHLNIPVPEPRKKPAMPPPSSKNAGEKARPQARQALHGERAEPHLQSDPQPRMHMAGGPHMPPPRAKPTTIKPKKTNKLAWLVLIMLFAVGIGGGAYLGSNRTWEGLTERSITASGSVPFPQPQPAEPLASAGANDNAGDVGPDDMTAAPVQPPEQAAAPAAPAMPPQAAAPAPTEAPASTPAAQAQPEQALAAAAPASEATQLAAAQSDSNAQKAAREPSETELWRSASASNKIGAYEDFLSAFPKGRYAAVARLRLERLQARQAQAAASEPRAPVQTAKAKPETPMASVKSATQSAEEQAWTRATTIDNAPAYQAYLNEYPRGGYAALAKDRLASMKAAPPAAQQSRPADPSPAASPEPTRQAAVKPPAMQASKPVPQAAPKPEPVQVDTDLPAITGNQTLRFGDQTMTGDFDVDPKSGLVSGKVRITWNNGNQFEGALVRGSKEGKGRFTWANGQRYSGDWSRDLPNGRGRFVFVDGSRYEGDVKDGTPHGQGSYWFKGGNVYSGDWVRGKSHGYGRYTFANGSYWEGEFRDDKRTENGKMGFPDSPVRTATGTAGSSGAQSAGAQAVSAGAANN